MRNLLFAGNTLLTIGYSSFHDRCPDAVESYPIRPIIATAPRTGRIVGLRTNISHYGAVTLGCLQVGGRTIYESIRPEGYMGLSGFDVAHPHESYRSIEPFMVERDQLVIANVSYSGLQFPGVGRDFNYSMCLEWIYLTFAGEKDNG